MTLTATLADFSKTIVTWGLPRLVRGDARIDAPLPKGEPIRAPHGRFGFKHYNVVIPDLPEPHRHLTCLVMAGRPGAAVFDDDALTQYTPRDTVTLAIGTAATGSDGFRVYSIAQDCELPKDGSVMRFADDLTITGQFPEYHIVINRPNLQLDITARCTNQITWFMRHFVYRHYGFPAEYEGTLTFEGKTQHISGVLSLESASSVSLAKYRRSNKPLPTFLKVPWHYFTWHVTKPHPDTLLMFGGAGSWGKEMLNACYVKQVNGLERRFTQPEQVTFVVLRYQDTPHIAHDGTEMFLPAEFLCRAHDDDGKIAVEVIGRTDTDADALYGLGKGWLTGYSYTGHLDGEPIEGHGYYEYARIK